MKTITIDDKKIEISDESYEAFKKQFMTEDKAILWKPNVGEGYYYLAIEGLAYNTTWWNNIHDRYCYEMGNVFKTKEEAQEALDTGWVAKREAEVKLLRFIAENDLEFGPDWDDDDEDKCCVRYSHDSRSFQIGESCTQQYSILPHFKSREDAQKVIDAMTPELKILFGVK